MQQIRLKVCIKQCLKIKLEKMFCWIFIFLNIKYKGLFSLVEGIQIKNVKKPILNSFLILKDNFLNFRDVKIFSTLLLHIFEEKLGQCEVKKCTKGQKTKISQDLKKWYQFFLI